MVEYRYPFLPPSALRRQQELPRFHFEAVEVKIGRTASFVVEIIVHVCKMLPENVYNARRSLKFRGFSNESMSREEGYSG